MSIIDSIKSLFSKPEIKTSLDDVLNHPETITEEALAKILEKAHNGNVENSLFAGLLYLKGVRIPQDPQKALEYLDKSARSGNLQAQKILAHEYLNGLIIPQDLNLAFEWFQKASYSGDIESTFYLGLMYEEGLSVAKDINKAIEYYQTASSKGYIGAKVSIADIYFKGTDLPRDRVKACQMYKEITAGDVSTIDVGRIYRDLGQAYSDTFCECGLTKEEGIDFLKKAIEYKYFDAVRIFALLGPQLDPEDKKWLFEFSSQNPTNSHCLFATGICYENGYGTDPNINVAFDCYRKSSELGDSWAKHYTAQSYLEGRGVEKNFDEWLKFETQAALENVPPAQYCLGIRYLKGIGVDQDQERAISLLTKAANNHDSQAIEIMNQLRNFEEQKANAATQMQAQKNLIDQRFNPER